MKSKQGVYWKNSLEKTNRKDSLSKKSRIKGVLLAKSMNMTTSRSTPEIIEYYFNNNHNVRNGFGLKRNYKSIKAFPPLLTNHDNSRQSIGGVKGDNSSMAIEQRSHLRQFNTAMKSLRSSSKVQDNAKEEIHLSLMTLPRYNSVLSPKNSMRTYHYIIKPQNCGRIVKKCFEHRINWSESPEYASSMLSSSTAKKGSCLMHFNFKWQQNCFGIDYGLLSKNPSNKQMVNHFEFNSSISNKANLFMNMMRYTEGKDEELFRYLPLTILFNYDHPSFINKFYSFEQLVTGIQSHLCAVDYLQQKHFIRPHPYSQSFPFEDKLGSKTSLSIPHAFFSGKSLWIIKAPDLNRGRCIEIVDSASDVKKCIKFFSEGVMKGYSCEKEESTFDKNAKDIYSSSMVLVQKYLEKPLLYHNRKFDIRIWVLLTHEFTVYVFKEGHLKTCSINYDAASLNKYSHLTNYSLQKSSTHFSKHEYGNEVSFDQFEAYLKQTRPQAGEGVFKHTILKRIKSIISMTFFSVKTRINSLDRKHCFELFGYDFILDDSLNPFLIEVNSNPGLEESSPLIKALVPRMIDDTLRLTVDKVFDTKYSFDANDDMYQSPFPVKGYCNSDNLWEFIADLNRNDEQERVPLYKFRYKMNFGKHKVQK